MINHDEREGARHVNTWFSGRFSKGLTYAVTKTLLQSEMERNTHKTDFVTNHKTLQDFKI